MKNNSPLDSLNFSVKTKGMISNSTKVWLFLLTLCMTFLILGHQIGGRVGLFVSLILIFSAHLILFLYGENRLLDSLRAQSWKGQDPWGLLQVIREYSEKLSMTPPDLYIYESDNANAFFLGSPWNKSSLSISTGLLQNLTPPEVHAIVAHQLCHLQKSDHFFFVTTGLLANSIVGIGEFMDYIFFKLILRQSQQNWFRHLFSPFAWLFIKIPIRTHFFYDNDQKTIEIFPFRDELASALWKIEHISASRPHLVPACTGHLFVVNPEGPLQNHFFLNAHPPTTERIKRLIGSYPI